MYMIQCKISLENPGFIRDHNVASQHGHAVDYSQTTLYTEGQQTEARLADSGTDLLFLNLGFVFSE